MNALRTLGFSIAAAGLVAAAPAAAAPAAAYPAATPAAVPAAQPMAATTAVPLPPPPAAAAAPAPEAAGSAWNTQYGMLFSLQNVFTQSGILGAGKNGDVGGGIGLQYNLAPQTALRFAVNAGRTSNPPYETTSTSSTGAPDKSFFVPAGDTSTFDVAVSGSYLMRLTSAALAPYVGAGVQLGYSQNSRYYEDDITVAGTTHKVDNYSRTYGLGLLGQLGLEWRVHKSLSLFAEYGISVDAVSVTSAQMYDGTTTGGVTSFNKTTGSQTRFFNFGTGLNQGAALGVVAFF